MWLSGIRIAESIAGDCRFGGNPFLLRCWIVAGGLGEDGRVGVADQLHCGLVKHSGCGIYEIFQELVCCAFWGEMPVLVDNLCRETQNAVDPRPDAGTASGWG